MGCDNEPMKNLNERVLVNPRATKSAQRLFAYICQISGENILSGQQESTWVTTPDDEMDYIYKHTGCLPAIRGLDYIDNDFAGVTERAIEWWRKGGIVSICWHWGVPPDGLGYESSKGEIDLEEVLKEGTDLNKGLLHQMDQVAEALKQLRDENVPVLWRPFHEFDGGWFWWGKGGADCFIQLWRLMYNYFTDTHQLHHLIWVLGYSGEVKQGWYPGDEYVDIAGADTYRVGIQKSMYQKVVDIVGESMPIAYHECGPMPDPEKLMEAHVKWVWFLTWHTIHIKEQNSIDELKYIYQHPYVLTLKDLPNLCE